MENSAEFYYEKLKGSINPGAVLAAFYCSMYGREVSRAEIIMFNQLIKVFGRFTTFFSVVDMVGTYPNGVEEPRAMLYTICKRKFEASHADSGILSRESLDGYIAKLQKEIDSLAKGKGRVPSPKGLEPDGR